MLLLLLLFSNGLKLYNSNLLTKHICIIFIVKGEIAVILQLHIELL